MIREYPTSQTSFLKFQVGNMETRFNVAPVDCYKLDLGFKTTSEVTKIFHLKGWGETMEAAQKMASKYERK